MKSILDTWKAFIKAQEVFINQYAEPFSISYTKTDNENFLHFDIEEKNPLNSIDRIIHEAFPEVNDDEINLIAGYLHYDSSLSPQISEEIIAEAEANYLELDNKPCFSGTIKEKSNAFRWLKEEIAIKKLRMVNTSQHLVKSRKSIQQLKLNLSSQDFPKFVVFSE